MATEEERARVHHLSELMLSTLTGHLIRINLREAEGSEDTLSIPLSSLEALERIEQELDMSATTKRHHFREEFP